MARASLHSDEKLLNAGVALARKKGLSGFTVRELCARAKVNLGMFHYHFKTKERFDREIMRTLYAEMIADIGIEVSPQAGARKNVEHILKSVNAFIRKNRVLLSALARDIMGGDKQTLQFITQNFTQHVSLLLTQLRRGKLSAAASAQPLASVAVTLLLPVVMPQLFCGTIERLGGGVLPAQIRAQAAGIWSESTAAQRIRLLLDGVFGEEK